MSADRGRYSRVSRRIWNSQSFRSLAQPKPCSAWLFFRLLTGPELSNIPGLFQAWESGLAEALRWPLKDFRKAFAEVSAQNMAKADWSVGLIWLPSAIHHNEPENPNVVIGWRTAWQELPECQLKDDALASLHAWAKAKGDSWSAALAKATGKAFDNTSDNSSPKSMAKQKQKQKQEQEQEQKQDGSPPDLRGRFPMHPNWRPSEDTMRSFDVALIPRWGSEGLISLHRTHFCAKKDDIRTDPEWNQSCSKWVIRDWNNPQKRPKKPEPEDAPTVWEQ